MPRHVLRRLKVCPHRSSIISSSTVAENNDNQREQAKGEQQAPVAASAEHKPSRQTVKQEIDDQQSADIRRLEALEAETQRITRGTYRLAKLGFAIAAAGVGASILQWCAMRDQVDLTRLQIAAAQDSGIGQQRATNRALAIAESQAGSSKLLADTMHSNERARLFVQNVFLATPGMFPRVAEPVKAIIEIANSGRTVAKHVRGNLAFEVLPAKRPAPGDRVKSLTGDHSIPPNAGGVASEIDLELTENGKNVGPLSLEKLQVITDGSAVLYVHGRIEYQDIFGSPHWITVCREWKADVANLITGQRGGWGACKQKQPTDDDEQSP